MRLKLALSVCVAGIVKVTIAYCFRRHSCFKCYPQYICFLFRGSFGNCMIVTIILSVDIIVEAISSFYHEIWAIVYQYMYIKSFG